jgi:predicted component of viral defense system (DUF524 family)
VIPPAPYLPHLQTRLRDPLYGRAFTSLRRLRMALYEGAGPELLGLKDLWLIYEYWVYLRVVEQLKTIFPKVVAASSSLVREMGGQLYLVKGIESMIELRDGAGRGVVCYYNRLFSNLPTTNQIPDITIANLQSGDVLIIDAKYKLARSPRYLTRYGMPGPDEEDINVLHRYRDAIVDGDPTRRIVQSGLIAFPGSDLDEYKMHHFYRSWETAQIGGVPMLPGGLSLFSGILDESFAVSTSDGPDDAANE